MQLVFAYLAGLLFAVGLGVSGMTRPTKVIGFLDPFGAWDPSLLFVMVGAIVVYAVGFRLVTRRARPIACDRFVLPTKTELDRKLVVGAVIFGVGWGLGGFCPGPGLVSSAGGAAGALVFVASMVVGMLGFAVYERLRAR